MYLPCTCNAIHCAHNTNGSCKAVADSVNYNGVNPVRAIRDDENDSVTVVCDMRTDPDTHGSPLDVRFNMVSDKPWI